MDKRTLLFMACVSASFLAVNTIFDLYIKEPAKPIVKQETPKRIETPASSIVSSSSTTFKNDEFYVLENDYQQLVFSASGASIAEINLPLKGKNEKSYVKEIAIDREMNASFPLKKAVGSENRTGGYYPLLRRGVAPEYYATSLISDSGEKATYKVTRFEKNLIQFETTLAGQKIIKTYTLEDQPYCFKLDLFVEGDIKDFWISSGIPDVEIVSNSYTPALRVLAKNEVNTLDLPQKEQVSAFVSPRWISNCNGFLGIILHPLDTTASGYKSKMVEAALAPSRLTLFDPLKFPADSYPGYATYLPVKGGSSSFRVFAGPYDTQLFALLDQATEKGSEYTQAVEIQGWFSFISQPFSQFLSWLMGIFYTLTHSWAASIILLTITLRAMMFPLNNWSIRSSVKTQQLSPRIQAIQERYKKDPKKAQMEIMNLYRESGVNPLTGCLPVILQMPFLFGMFYLLKSSVPLRGASFIPGWIDDLSAPDVLFSWNQPIWLIGNQFHLLPILMGFTMYLQQKMTSTLPKDESKLTDAQKQQKMMGPMMAILFTVMFYKFPSGLNIYFMLSTLLGVAQQAWVMSTMKKHQTV